MIGKYVIVRTYSAGVHIGTLETHEGTEVLLKDARRLWYWKGAFTLNEVALEGIKTGSKLSAAVPHIMLTQAVEILPVAPEIESLLKNWEVYKP